MTCPAPIGLVQNFVKLPLLPTPGHHLRHRLGGYIEIAHVEVGTVDHVERGRVEECTRVGVCKQAGEFTGRDLHASGGGELNGRRIVS